MPQITVKPIEPGGLRASRGELKEVQNSLDRAWVRIKKMEARMNKWKRLIKQIADRVALKSEDYLEDKE